MMLSNATKAATALAVGGMSSAVMAASPVECRRANEPALFKNIEARQNSVVFDYYASELIDAYTVEFVDCKTNASISAAPSVVYSTKRAQQRETEKIRVVLRKAVASDVVYSREQVVNAIAVETQARAGAGKLGTLICACDKNVLSNARRYWRK